MSDLDELAVAAGESSPEEPSEWSVHVLGQTYGPYTTQELLRYIANGQIPPGAQACRPGMPAWVPVTHVAQTFAVAQVPTFSPTISRRPTASNPFHAWARRSGGRSFIFQCIIAGWTVVIILLLARSLLSIDTKSRRVERFYGKEEAEEAMAVSMFGSLTCLGGAWAIVAVPCGMAAIATFESGRPRS